jgi:hypothetical protein
LLYEIKEGFTGKLLLDGFCLTGLICDAGASADDYSAKSQDNSERFHWLLPRLGRDANSLRTSPYRSPSPDSAPAFSNAFLIATSVSASFLFRGSSNRIIPQERQLGRFSKGDKFESH